MQLMRLAIGIALLTSLPGWAQNAPVGDPLVVDPSHYHLEIDNQWVRRLGLVTAFPNKYRPYTPDIMLTTASGHSD